MSVTVAVSVTEGKMVKRTVSVTVGKAACTAVLVWFETNLTAAGVGASVEFRIVLMVPKKGQQRSENESMTMTYIVSMLGPPTTSILTVAESGSPGCETTRLFRRYCLGFSFWFMAFLAAAAVGRVTLVAETKGADREGEAEPVGTKEA